MNILNQSNEFHDFLDTIISSESIKSVFLDKYEASVYPPESISPFSDVVGPSSNFTVIFSNIKEKSYIGEEFSSGDLSSILEGVDLSGLTPMNSTGKPSHIVSHRVVKIGQSLVGKRSYLADSLLYHQVPSDAIVKAIRDCNFSPLSLQASRFIISLYSLCCQKKRLPLPDVWTMCGNNQLDIVALGCMFDISVSTLRIVTIKQDAAADSVPSVGKSGFAFSEYEITSSDDTTVNRVISSDLLTLQFSWSDQNVGILSSPPECSDGVVLVSNAPGHQLSPILPLFVQLKSLHMFCRIASGKMEWPKCDDEEVVTSVSSNKKIQGLIEELSLPITNRADVTVLSPAYNHVVFEARDNLDFIERLWSCCCSLGSYAELQLLLAETMKSVVLGKIQPFIHKESSSTLAMLLRQVMMNRDRENIQDVAVKSQLLLSGSRLIPCLVDIGLEKMKRDYCSFFVGADILSPDHFEKFFNPGKESHLDRCLEMCKLHNITELDISLMKILNLPLRVISTFTKAVMEVYKKDVSYQPFSQSPVFALSLPAYSPGLKSVAALCSKFSPSTWRLVPQTTCKNSSVILKRSKPMLNYLHDSEENSTVQYSYYAECEMIPV